MRTLQRKVQQGKSAALHGGSSKEIYDQYGDRELRDFESGECRALVDGRLSRLSHRQVRDAYLAPIQAEIQRLASELNRPVRVLEVGCGNGTNLMLMKQQFGDQVKLCGIDISLSRIDVGRQFWGESLQGIEFQQTSATDLSMYGNGRFDVVYSVCALEQITYRIPEVVSEMERVAAHSVVCVEPVYEYGNAVQRLYNIVNDQCRTLLHDLRESSLQIEEQGILRILHNPLNPVGVVIGRKVA